MSQPISRRGFVAASVAIAASAAAAQTGAAVEQDVRAKVQALADAFLAADAERLSKLIHADYIHTNTGGSVVNKQQMADVHPLPPRRARFRRAEDLPLREPECRGADARWRRNRDWRERQRRRAAGRAIRTYAAIHAGLVQLRRLGLGASRLPRLRSDTLSRARTALSELHRQHRNRPAVHAFDRKCDRVICAGRAENVQQGQIVFRRRNRKQASLPSDP